MWKHVWDKVKYFLPFLIVVIIWGAWEWTVDPRSPDEQPTPKSWYDANKFPDSLSTREIHGLWGDSFGGLNALFAGLAFAGLITTILIQLKDARDRENERHEDMFDQRFFRLLDTLRAALRNIKSTRIPIASGDEAIKIWIRSFHEKVIPVWRAGSPEGERKDPTSVDRFSHDYQLYEYLFGSYFRTLEILLNEVSLLRARNSGKAEEYLEILRTQMSSVQLALTCLYVATNRSPKLAHLLRSNRSLFDSMTPEVCEQPRESFTELLNAQASSTV